MEAHDRRIGGVSNVRFILALILLIVVFGSPAPQGDKAGGEPAK